MSEEFVNLLKKYGMDDSTDIYNLPRNILSIPKEDILLNEQSVHMIDRESLLGTDSYKEFENTLIKDVNQYINNLLAVINDSPFSIPQKDIIKTKISTYLDKLSITFTTEWALDFSGARIQPSLNTSSSFLNATSSSMISDYLEKVREVIFTIKDGIQTAEFIAFLMDILDIDLKIVNEFMDAVDEIEIPRSVFKNDEMVEIRPLEVSNRNARTAIVTSETSIELRRIRWVAVRDAVDKYTDDLLESTHINGSTNTIVNVFIDEYLEEKGLRLSFLDYNPNKESSSYEAMSEKDHIETLLQLAKEVLNAYNDPRLRELLAKYNYSEESVDVIISAVNNAKIPDILKVK
jgi:hypothetical protein